MPSGWDVYYVILLSALLALGVPLVLGLVSWIVRPPRTSAEQPDTVFETRIVLGRRINARFFLAANAALILIALILALVPATLTLQRGGSASVVLRGLVCIVSIAGFAAVGLLYSARKGDLGWLSAARGIQEKK